ncbi:MAG TPA: TetR-like C-terminal domain-containing protein [Pilimelia sp.]|nr:TetR-like C-terminal domain-containing protein [Pilimelia sp.]
MSAAASIRARVRAEMLEEIKAVARRHLATDGANLSLRAVARDMGMVSSAVYRYVPSRDELLTALIIDAYDALGAAVEAAEARVDRDDLRGRWLAVCDAVRAWARAQPAEYALIYGTPVPGYAAPGDTVGPASRPTLVLVALLADALHRGAIRPDAGEDLPATVREELTRVAADAGADVPPGTLDRGFTAWIQLFGLLSFEIFGRFKDTLTDLDGYFAHQMRRMADLLGLP